MKSLVQFSIVAVFATSLAINPSTTKAAPFNLFFEDDSGSVLGDGVQVQTYATLNDVLTSNLASSEPTSWTVGPDIDLAGVAFDGQYRLFFEDDSGSVLGDGVQVQTYATLNDVLTYNLASSEPTSWTVGPDIDLAGVAFDGQYRLFFEDDSGSVLGDGVQVQTYATFNDVLTLNLASSEPTSWTVGPDIDLAGVAFDGQYRLFFEDDSGSVLGDGVQVQTYATLNDVLTYNLASSEPTSWTIGPNTDLAGIASPGSKIPSVSSPATVWILLISLGRLGLFDWRGRRTAARSRTPLYVRGFRFSGSLRGS